MQVTASWANTARGPALYISLAGRRVALLESDLGAGAAHCAAISLYEGMTGSLPSGWFRRWHWRRDLARVERGIEQAIAEEGAYSE